MDGTMPRLRLHGVVLLLIWSAVLVALFANAARRVGGPTGDFVHFYEAARAIVHGEDIYASGRGGYIYPPLLAFLYAPVAGLREDTAAVVLLVFNMAVLLASCLPGRAGARAALRHSSRRVDHQRDCPDRSPPDRR